MRWNFFWNLSLVDYRNKREILTHNVDYKIWKLGKHTEDNEPEDNEWINCVQFIHSWHLSVCFLLRVVKRSALRVEEQLRCLKTGWKS